MTSNPKKTSPDVGLYIRVESAKTDNLYAQLRQIFMPINRSEYEKNMQIMELSLTPDHAMGAAALQMFADLGKNNGCVVLVKDDLELAERLGADGVVLTDASQIAAAKEAVDSDSGIVGLYCGFEIDKAQTALDAALDFVVFGDPDSAKLPTEQIAWWQEKAADKPAAALGKITNDNALEVIVAGATFLCADAYMLGHEKGPMQGAVNMLYAMELATQSSRSIN